MKRVFSVFVALVSLSHSAELPSFDIDKVLSAHVEKASDTDPIYLLCRQKSLFQACLLELALPRSSMLLTPVRYQDQEHGQVFPMHVGP